MTNPLQRLVRSLLESFPARNALGGHRRVRAADVIPLIHNSMSPVAVVGSCRSGKSTSFIVPSLLTWRESAVVFDLQGELQSVTEGWRRSCAHNKIRQLAFGDPSSPDTFNFLDAIPWGHPDELFEIQSLAMALIPGAGFWQDQARALLMLFVIAAHSRRWGQTVSLADVQRAVASDDEFHATVLAAGGASPRNEIDHAARTAAKSYADLAENARSAVRKMVSAALEIFASPVVDRNTRHSTFNLAELRSGSAPVTIYLTAVAHQVAELQPLIRLFLAQLVRQDTRQQPLPVGKRLLLVLDELPALGKLDFLESALPFMPGHGIKAMMTFQCLPQLSEIYGKENDLWASCVIRAALRCNDVATATAVAGEINSELPQKKCFLGVRLKPSISPREVLCLAQSEVLIWGAARKPVRTTALPYFKDPRFHV